MSLIELVIGVGIMAIVMSGMISMQLNQQREARAITEKLATLDFERLLQSSMMDGSTCKFLLNNPTALTFDATALGAGSPQYITPTHPLYARVVGGVPGPVIAQVDQPLNPDRGTLVPQLIRLKVESGIENTYVGRWEVHWKSSLLVRALKPVSVATLLTVDKSNPSAARIIDCTGTGTAQMINRTHHVFCATPVGGLVLKPDLPNRICTLSAVDDDSGNTVASDYKCRVQIASGSWRGFAPLSCGLVACMAVCFDIQ